MDEPTVNARLVRRVSCNEWVVDKCPHCGRKHHHGAGKHDEPPRDCLGHRLAHCLKGGYFLAMSEDQQQESTT